MTKRKQRGPSRWTPLPLFKSLETISLSTFTVPRYSAAPEKVSASVWGGHRTKLRLFWPKHSLVYVEKLGCAGILLQYMKHSNLNYGCSEDKISDFALAFVSLRLLR
jgi:hypothetical protein